MIHLTADANSQSWGFWNAWADGSWEPKTNEVIQRCCNGGTFVDIGAWVGPTSLWAIAAGYSRVIAIEPDPLAFEMLTTNTGDLAVERYDIAVMGHDGSTFIESRGDSMARAGIDDADHPQVLTRCVTLPTLFHKLGIENVDLIKIDTEGAEAVIIPEAVDFLRDLGAPVHLSLHPWAEWDWRTVLAGWSHEPCGDNEWLVTP